ARSRARAPVASSFPALLQRGAHPLLPFAPPWIDVVVLHVKNYLGEDPKAGEIMRGTVSTAGIVGVVLGPTGGPRNGFAGSQWQGRAIAPGDRPSPEEQQKQREAAKKQRHEIYPQGKLGMPTTRQRLDADTTF